MTATKTGRVVFTGTWDWWQIVSRDEIDLDDSGTYDRDHEAAGELAELNQDDEESWVARVTAVDERHSAIRVGDYAVAPNGIGGDVVFVRLT